MVNVIANPPIFDTDVPTSENYFTHTIGASTGGAIPAHNFTHPYAQQNPGFIAQDNAPLGHGQNGQGIYGLTFTKDDSYYGYYALRLAFHKQSGNVIDYQTGWRVSDPALASTTPSSGAFDYRTYGNLAAQRLGDYVYVITWNSTRTGSMPDGFGFPTRFDTNGNFKIFKVGPSGNPTTVLNQTISTVSEDPAIGITQCPLPGLISGYGAGSGSRTELFVSDDATPFIWHTSGDISNLWVGGNPVWTCAFQESGGSPGSWKDSNDGKHHLTGQIGAYAQQSHLPAGQYGFGPYLVHPWSAGNYGPPEQWYFICRGAGKQCAFDIYRSVWARGQYVRDSSIVLADDSAFMANSRQYPAGNPDGWAFDHDWYQASKKVGTCGPFPDADVLNRADAHGNSIVYPYFRVLRDRKRIGQLHIVFGDGKPISGGGVTF